MDWIPIGFRSAPNVTISKSCWNYPHPLCVLCDPSVSSVMQRTRRYIITIGFDLIFIVIALAITFLIKGSKLFALPQAYGLPILIFTVVWILGSLIGRKYDLAGTQGHYEELTRTLKTNVLLLLVLTFIIFFVNMNYSRGVLLGATAITTALELLVAWMFVLMSGATELKENGKNGEDIGNGGNGRSSATHTGYDARTAKVAELTEGMETGNAADELNALAFQVRWRETTTGEGLAPLSQEMRAPVVFDTTELHESIAELIGEEGFEFINRVLQEHPGQSLFVATTTRFNIQAQPSGIYRNIVNLRRINDIPRINKFFEDVNAALPTEGVYIDCVETTGQRRARIMAKFPPVINNVYYFFDYIFKRVFPKLPVTKEIYFFLTRGNNRVLSKAETLGRLYSCGFELLSETQSHNMLFFAVRKIKAPAYDMQPTYGPLIKLRRRGKNGTMIGVYKMRTMHPFSEYLQDYMYQRNNLAIGGKIANDFRVTSVGRFMRRFWLDELPMLINLVKGDLKLVGVRPLSKQYFSLYPEDMQQRRSKYRPGLVPPFYVDMPKSFCDIVDSERRYLDLYDKHPWKTDWIYFWSAMNNILIKRARSG